MSGPAACTIVSKNYIAYARVLADSFLDHHPDGRFFVLLVDRNAGRIDPAAERFTLIEIEELENVSELPAFLFKYSLLECNTAIKPFFLEHLLARYELPSLIYFDPDILITHALDDLFALMEAHAIVLTPHLTAPIEDHAHPGELAVLQSGSFNLGFIALRRAPAAEQLLAWWKDRLHERCVVRVEEGLFVDQKWIDLAPGLFKDVHMLTHPGYNVAYWNLHDRNVTLEDAGPRVNGEPLVFFHFSGIDPDNLAQVSKHQDRYVLSDLGPAADLYRRYRDLVLAAGYREARPWPYAFGRFADGAAIPDIARRLYLSLGKRRRRFGDPFATGPGTFYAWLNGPHDPKSKKPPYFTRLLFELYRTRPDLQAIFPDPAGRDFAAFCSWLEGFGRFEFRLDDAFLTTIHRETRATLLTPGGLERRLRNRMKRLYHSPLGRESRRLTKRLLGHERSRELRQRLRPGGALVDRPGAHGSLGPYRLAPPRGITHTGINVVGYLQAETGMGQAARALVRALEQTSIPISTHSLDLNVLARNADATFAPEASAFPYDVNLFVVNADQILPVREHLGPEVFGGRYNIGYHLWELDRFPQRWLGAFDVLHEVWTPSTFCVDAIGAVAPLPVRRVPLPVGREPGQAYDRTHFELPADAFVFLFVFNYLSYFERKNPIAVVEAFRRAFPDGDEALLVLKTSQGDFAPEARARLEKAAGTAPVRLIDAYFARDEVTALIGAADCYVSLHRSEGFGLTLAEAMLQEKPVIATPYGGVTDFFNLNSGFPVRYRPLTIERDEGPYSAGGHWADPDVEHAAKLMRQVYGDHAARQAIAVRGRRDVEEMLSYQAVGAVIEERFDALVRGVNRRALHLR